MSSKGNTEALRTRSTHEAYWKSRARMVVLIINACWILSLGVNLVTLMALLYIVLVICRFGANAYWITALAFSISSIVALTRRIRSGTFMSWQDGLILLEDRLGLESALSSAHDGAASWPPPQKIPRLFQPRVRWLLLPVLAVGTAWQVQGWPESYAVAAGEMPNRGKELKKTLDKIKEQKLVDPEEIEKLTQAMDDLNSQDPRNLLSHESMEAMDGLKERLDAAVDANQQALDKLQEAFSALKDQSTDSDSGKRREPGQKIEEALGNLSSGALPLDPQLLKQLRELSDSATEQEDSEKALQGLKDAQEAFGSLNDQGKPGPGQTSGESGGGNNQGNGRKSGEHSESRQSGNGTSDGRGGNKDGKEPREGKGGNQTSNKGEKGSGGVSRGPGEAPLNLFEKPPAMTSQSEAELKSGNDKHDSADEVTEIIRRRPEVITPAQPNTDTDITTQNGTSSATWNDALTPDEEETLKQVLK